MTVAWVLGSGGLLGAALCRSLRFRGTEVFDPAVCFAWRNAPTLERQLTAAVHAFGARIANAGPWEIYWAAGVGNMSSSADILAPETAALSILLQLTASQPELTEAGGTFALASSAGAIFAGASDFVITENTRPAPTTPYAREKLRQEDLVRSFALGGHGISAIVARISTLYGAGEAARKRHGLISHMARRILHNQPIHIYVPFDSVRDYLTADDAASMIVASARLEGRGRFVRTKLIASEQPTSVAEIIAVFKRIARRAPRIITSVSNEAAAYPSRVLFRSVVPPETLSMRKTTLPVGIAQVIAAERALFVR